MASWATLNATSAPRSAALEEGRDGATVEAQEARCAVLYGRALRLQQQQKVEEARTIYTEVLETSTGLSARLRYLCAKNLATLEAERRAFDTALQRFSEALALDDTDVLVWYQMGKAALETGQLWQARQAFEAGFQVDATFWPLVQALCDVLHTVGDGAAYQRVARYLLERDPGAGQSNGPLAAMDRTVDPEFRVCVPRIVKSTLKRPTPASKAFAAATKKRKAMDDVNLERVRATANRAPLNYILQQSSWLSLGKLLLEAYDDVSSEEGPGSHIATRRVKISADLRNVPNEQQSPKDERGADSHEVAKCLGEMPVNESMPTIDLTTEEANERADDGTARVPIEIDDGDDGDQDAAGNALQANRRKSRRHQEKLREEHELAAKIAREKNLEFRLRAFVPEVIREDTDSAFREIRFRLDGDSVILEHKDGGFVHKFENVLPSIPHDDAPDQDDASKENDSLNTGESGAVDREHILKFVERTMGDTDGVDIFHLLQTYLNQCGAWAEQTLGPPSEDPGQTIHLVCLWAEKVVRGRLEPAPSTPSARTSDKVIRSRINVRRCSNDGLTIEARLFLLELQLDELMYNKSQECQSKSRKAARAYHLQLDYIVRAAQELVLDICLHANDATETGGDVTEANRLLVRLFWLCGNANEVRGNTAAAREFFSKCKLAFDDLGPGVLVSLPNLRSKTVVSIPSVDQKIVSLQFSNVCTEVQEMTTTSRFDEAQGRLLAHFFPTNGQATRIGELLDDFANAKQREQDNGDGPDDAESNEHNLLELLLESIEKSKSSNRSDKVLLLLVILQKLLEVLSENLEKVTATPKKTDNERQTMAVAIQAIEHTVDRLATVIDCDEDPAQVLCTYTKQAIAAVVTTLLDPKILLLFDSPRDVLQVIHGMAVDPEKADDDAVEANTVPASSSEIHIPLVVAAARSFITVRSLSMSERERMLTVLTAPSTTTKSKKRQSVRHDRVRAYVQSVVGLLAGHAKLLALKLPAQEVRLLLEACCPLLKEEEDHSRRHNDGERTARKTFAAGAILFVQLVMAIPATYTDNESTLRKLVGLIRLLHDRLGEHELCSLDCFDKSIGSGSCIEKSFIQVAVSILQDKYEEYESIQQSRRQLRRPSRDHMDGDGEPNSGCEGNDGENMTADGEDGEEEFDHTLAQCYRCLYDAHIQSGTSDHKSGGSIADLENAPASVSLNLARFAIPIMLRRPPRSNAQKKENLKILFAIQRAVNQTQDARQQQPHPPPKLLLEYLSPKTLLSWGTENPVSILESMPCAPADSSLEHLWFLLGENFILVRVRKRSNLSELIEMERKIKERIAYLLKDVQHYRPRRIKSWLRLGRSTKELYQVSSDACALVLGRNWRKANIVSKHLRGGQVSIGCEVVSDVSRVNTSPSFADVVLGSSLFEKMKSWHDLEDDSQKASYRVSFHDALKSAEDVELDVYIRSTEYTIEETAELFLSQVVEFSRRCFSMAAALAMDKFPTSTSGNSIHGVKDEIPEPAEDNDNSDDMDQTAVDAYEECGLLMYNQLRELAGLRQDNDVSSSEVFPTSHYNQLLDSALTYFKDGLRWSTAKNPEAHDVRFRFHYMIGKLLKKQLDEKIPNPIETVEIERSRKSPPSLEDVLRCFASAEEEHEKGKMDKSIVHAFYQLQAVRLSLILKEPISVENLRLACDHYFEEASEDESAGEDEDDDDMDNDAKAESESTADKVRKDDVNTLLRACEETQGGDLLVLAQGWLFYNVIDALDSISDEDRYFHASRYALARAMYHYNSVVERLSLISDGLPHVPPSTSANNCITALAEKKSNKKNDGVSSAEIALKEMHPLFDKRRPQIVAIWLSEHVPVSKKFEELNQRQIKFDFCRIKYFSYFVELLQECEAYGRLKEIGSWVLACKEEHDAIGELLGIVLRARGVVQLSRLREYVSTELVNQLERYHKSVAQKGSQSEKSTQNAIHLDDSSQQSEDIDAESASESLLKELSKAYVNYLDVANSFNRLAGVMSSTKFQETQALAEFPIVCLYMIGASEFSSIFEVLERDDTLTASYIVSMTFKLRAVILNDVTPQTLTSAASFEWRPLLNAARTFCEDRWPDRQGSGRGGTAAKHVRKGRHVKASTPTSTTTIPAHSAASVIAPVTASVGAVGTTDQPAQTQTPVDGVHDLQGDVSRSLDATSMEGDAATSTTLQPVEN